MMTLRLIISTLCLFAVLPLAAQLKMLPRETVMRNAGLMLSADSTALSFENRSVKVSGLSEDSAPKSYYFHLTNASGHPLEITRISTNCSCVKASLPKMELETGENTVLTAVYDPKGHPGKFRRMIFIYTGASDEYPAAVLVMEADVAWRKNKQ